MANSNQRKIFTRELCTEQMFSKRSRLVERRRWRVAGIEHFVTQKRRETLNWCLRAVTLARNPSSSTHSFNYCFNLLINARNGTRSDMSCGSFSSYVVMHLMTATFLESFGLQSLVESIDRFSTPDITSECAQKKSDNSDENWRKRFEEGTCGMKLMRDNNSLAECNVCGVLFCWKWKCFPSALARLSLLARFSCERQKFLSLFAFLY